MSRPSAPIEVLPQEILDEILKHCSPRELARLQQCSRHLFQRLEPTILGLDPVRRHTAMTWACSQGINSLVDRCISQGASVDIVIPSSFGNMRMGGQSTTHLALINGQLETFRHLVKNGGQLKVDRATLNTLPSGFTTDHLTMLVRIICHGGAPFLDAASQVQAESTYPTILSELLQGGYMAQLPRYYRSLTLYHVLQSSLHRPNILESLRLLLESGADPNFADMQYGRSGSVLAAAFWHHSQPVWDLLLRYGACADGGGKMVRTSARLDPRHVPVIVAARLMAIGRDDGPLKWCFQESADLNQTTLFRTWIRDPRTSWELNWHKESSKRIEARAPIHVFVDNVDSWAENTKGRNAIAGLTFLINHGARIEYRLNPGASFDDDYQGRNRIVDLISMGWEDGNWPSPIMLLMDRHGVEGLYQRPYLVDAMRMLVDYPPDEGLMRLLARYDFEAPLSDGQNDDEDKAQSIVAAWISIIDAVISNARAQGSLSACLSNYILAKGIALGLAEHEGRWDVPIGRLARATIRRFIECGAGINYQRPLRSGESRSHSTFERLCQLYVDWCDARVGPARDVKELSDDREYFLLYLVELKSFDVEVNLSPSMAEKMHGFMSTMTYEILEEVIVEKRAVRESSELRVAEA